MGIGSPYPKSKAKGYGKGVSSHQTESSGDLDQAIEDYPLVMEEEASSTPQWQLQT